MSVTVNIYEMKRISFSLFTMVFFFMSGPGLGLAQSYYSLPSSVQNAIALLTKEIARDEKIVSFPINITRVKMARKMIAPGLEPKQELIDGFIRFKAPELSDAINALRQTLAAEKSIIKETRTIEPVRLRTKRAIRNNIKLKKMALAIFNKWAADNGKY